MNRNILIFLTACVNPNGMKYTAVQDQSERLKQYINAIKFYLYETKFRILVVENTNVDLSKYIENSKHRLEILTFNGNNYDKNLGKGYGEALIMEYATKKSVFYKEADYVVKITGRNIILNINSLIDEMRNYSYVYANITSRKGRLQCQSRIVGFPKSYIEDKFLPNINFLDDSKEHFFEDLIFETAMGKIKDFYHPILIRGISGSTGETLSPTILTYIKAPIKYILHKFGLFKIHF